MDRGKFGTRVGDPAVLPAASLRSTGTVQPASPSIDPSCLVQIKIPFPLPFQHMVKAICAELGVERNSFGEQVVYRECQLSFLGVERTEFGQQTGQMSTRTPSRRGQSLGVQTVGFLWGIGILTAGGRRGPGVSHYRRNSPGQNYLPSSRAPNGLASGQQLP